MSNTQFASLLKPKVVLLMNSAKAKLQRLLRLTVTLLCCLFLLLPSASATETELRGGYLFDVPDGSQLVFRLSQPTQITTLTLDNPPRFVVDLNNTELGIAQLNLQSSDLLGVRSGVRHGRHLRLVLDLSKPMVANATILERQGYHLVIDLISI